jgi:hypothetical protein
MNFYLDDMNDQSYQPTAIGNNNPSNNPLWELNPLQEESPLASKNNSTTMDAGKVVPSAGSKMFDKPSYSSSVEELYGQKLTTGEQWARVLEPLIATLPAALIGGALGGRRGAGRAIQGGMKAIEPMQDERYKTEEARRQMFEKDPLNRRSYLNSIRQGYDLSGQGQQPDYSSLMSNEVQQQYANEDLANLKNPFDVLVQEGAGRQLPFRFDDISQKIAEMEGLKTQHESAARFPYQQELARMPQHVISSSSSYEPPKNPNLPMFAELVNAGIDKAAPSLPPWLANLANKLKTPVPQGTTKTQESSSIRAKGGQPVEPNRPSIKNEPVSPPADIMNQGVRMATDPKTGKRYKVYPDGRTEEVK